MNEPMRLDRTLIRVSGPQALEFLQNLLTQNLDPLRQAGLLYGGLLNPQGKLIADMLLWAEGEAIIIDADCARGGDLLRRLGMYKLRAQVELDDISASHCVLARNAPFAAALPDPRLPDLGWRALSAKRDALHGQDAYRARNIDLGIPDLAIDAAPEEVFALEALFEELHGVDFQKGCFVGQENVSRMKRRATTRKKFCPIAFEGAPPAFGAPILAGEAELGSVRSGRDGRALALLRLDRALGAAANGVGLKAGGIPLRLDPPAWLMIPPLE